MYHFERWKQLLDGARTDVEVMHLMREYSSAWRPSELALLPMDCRTWPFSRPQDIARLAERFRHAQSHFNGPELGRSLLHDLCATFEYAAARVKAVQAAPR
jgi:hypothetical protein